MDIFKIAGPILEDERIEFIAQGANAIATSQMLRAGANKGASGENAICRTVNTAQCIVGPIAITPGPMPCSGRRLRGWSPR